MHDHMKTIRSGALFALLGILLGPVLVNLVGFISPFIAVAADSADAANGGMSLLVLARKIAAPLTLLMVVAAWLLTPPEPEESSTVLVWRMLVRVSALSWAITSILAALDINYLRLGHITWTLFLGLGIFQIARICRQMQRDRLAAAAVVLLVVAVAAALLPAGDPNAVKHLFVFTGLRLVFFLTATVGIMTVLCALRRNAIAA